MKKLLKNNSKTLQSCLSVDFFKIQQTIPVYGKQYYKSLLGISVTYIQLLMTILAFFYFGRELFAKENPILIITENRLSLDNNYELDFERDKLWMNFGVFNENKFTPIDETYFNIFGEHKIYVPSKKGGEYAIKTTIFDLEQCSFDYLRKSYGSDKSIEELQYFQTFSYCFTNKIKAVNYSDNFPEEKKGDSSHMSIKGYFGSKEFSFINVKYSKCMNKSDQLHPVCKDPDEINRMLNTVFLGGKIINNYLKPMSYKNPINLDNEWFYSKVSLTNKKQLNLKLQRNILVSDTGIFLTFEEPTVFYSLASTSETEATNVNNNVDEDFVFCTSLHFDKIEKVYSRRYKKIEDVFAQVGGVLKSFLIIFSILLKPFASNSLKLDILFEFLKVKEGPAKEMQRASFDKKMKKNASKGYDEFLKIIDLNNIIRYMAYTKSLLIYLYPSGKRKQFKRKCEGDLRKKIYHIIQGNHIKKFKIDEQEMNKLQHENKLQEPLDKNQIWGVEPKKAIGPTPYVDDMSFHEIRVNEPIKINHFHQWNEVSERQKT